MSMNIPEETIRKAREVLRNVDHAYFIAEEGDDAIEGQVEAIATALHSAQMEERERCAKIVEEVTEKIVRAAPVNIGPEGVAISRVVEAVGKDISTAIRTTKAD